MSTAELIGRARRELDAARVLAEAGHGAPAVSRSYYGAFCAAEAALLELGETRSKHSGVVAAFVRLVVHQGGLDPKAGRLLRSLFDRRGQADYSTKSVPDAEARAAIADATIVIEEVARWLETRPS